MPTTFPRRINHNPDRGQTSLIGIISDTHGLVRPQVLEAFKGVEIIIHAGDIGNENVLAALEAVAPVVAVRGNNDRDIWAKRIPVTQVVDHSSHLLYVLHELNDLDLDPAAAEFSAVIFGHSHRPTIETRKGVLYLNPGSAGPRRFTLPISIARMSITEAGLVPEIIQFQT